MIKENKQLFKVLFSSGYLSFIYELIFKYNYKFDEIPALQQVFEKKELIEDKAVIEEGIRIGDKAKEYWTKFAQKNNYQVFDLTNFGRNTTLANKKTLDILQQNKKAILFESVFCYKNSIIRPDILIFDNKENGFKIFEVKAVNKLKGEHYLDVIFQQYILNKLNYKLKSISLMFLNKEYQFDQKLNLESLFKFADSLYMKDFYKPFFEYKDQNLIFNFSNVVHQNFPTTAPDDLLAEKNTKLNAELLLIQKIRNQYKIPNRGNFLEGNIKIHELDQFFITKIDPIYNDLKYFIKLLNNNSVILDSLNNDKYSLKFYKIAFESILEELRQEKNFDNEEWKKIISSLSDKINKAKLMHLKNKELQKKSFKNPEKKYKLGLIENLYNLKNNNKGIIKAITGKSFIEELNNEDLKKIKSKVTFNFSEINKIQIKVHKEKDFYLNRELLKFNLKEYKLPIYMIDFETISSAIPFEEMTSPYQQVPFQYSIHVLRKQDIDFFNKNGFFNKEEILSFDYLAQNKKGFYADLSENLLKNLFNFGKGTYVAYHKPFEKSVIKKMIELNILPDKEANTKLNLICEEMLDLKDLFYAKFMDGKKQQTKLVYYDYRLMGSFSIKATLPAIDSTFDYSIDLEQIHNGEEALNAFKDIMHGKIKGEKLITTRKNLLSYCSQDTWSMVKIYEFFLNLINY